jgi:hypothetical protein
MSDEEKLELQFERAELDRPTAPAGEPPPAAAAVPRVACQACRNNVRTYYTVNGGTFCKRCHDEAVSDHRGLALAPLLKALALGLVAAALGAAIYYGVAKLTGYEIGLVSIVVGLLVGGAVMVGSGGRGGWRFQALAVALCYLSIATSYGFFVLEAVGKRREAEAARVAQAPQAAPPGVQQASLTTGAEPAEPADEPAAESPGKGAILGELLLLVLKLPFLIGFESPMAFVLLGIALWEAWKLNAGQAFEAAGPFTVHGAAPVG